MWGTLSGRREHSQTPATLLRSGTHPTHSTGKQDFPWPVLHLPPQTPYHLNTNVRRLQPTLFTPEFFFSPGPSCCHPLKNPKLHSGCSQMAFTRFVTNSSNSSIPVTLGEEGGDSCFMLPQRKKPDKIIQNQQPYAQAKQARASCSDRSST